jgi:hypothetical protein
MFTRYGKEIFSAEKFIQENIVQRSKMPSGIMSDGIKHNGTFLCCVIPLISSPMIILMGPRGTHYCTYKLTKQLLAQNEAQHILKTD